MKKSEEKEEESGKKVGIERKKTLRLIRSRKKIAERDGGEEKGREGNLVQIGLKSKCSSSYFGETVNDIDTDYK